MSTIPYTGDDNLYLDMNGIIHPACHPADKPPPPTEHDIYLAVFDYLDRVFAIVRPRKLLYIAVDGVAPRAKMNQQRTRRFCTAQEAGVAADQAQRQREKHGTQLDPKLTSFDSNLITPGTQFITQLGVHLRNFIHRKITFDPGWQSIQVGSLRVLAQH